MAEEQKLELSIEELEALEDAKKIQAKRKEQHKARREQEAQPLSITSLMDIMTILLVFMLMNYATDPMNINPSDELSLVPSVSIDKIHERMTTMAITKNHLLVDDKPVVQVKDGKVPVTAKREGEDGYFITPLFDALKAQADNVKKLATYNKSLKFKGNLMIIGDEEAPFRLLSEVMYTAGQAEFGNFEFAVISNQ